MPPEMPGERRPPMQAPAILLPSRSHAYRADGGRFSLSAMADLAADCGYAGVDLSLDRYDRSDDGLPGMLYALRTRLAARGLTLPCCHLPFYMPSPDDSPALRRFADEQAAALRAAARLGIENAVIHPILRHGSRMAHRTGDPQTAWLEENIHYLTPLRELAGRLGLRLCVENMVGVPLPEAPDEAVYGSRAAHILALAEALDCGICWDIGHAHVTGADSPSESLLAVSDRLAVLHLHDNDGRVDAHRIPGEGTVDWAEVVRGLSYCPGVRCTVLELKTSELPADLPLRRAYVGRALRATADILGSGR